MKKIDNYYDHAELRIVDTGARLLLLKNILKVLGFEYLAGESVRGLSGLDHSFDAIGARPGNVVLLLCTQELPEGFLFSDQSKIEQWNRDALLKMYDTAAVFEREGLRTDLFFVDDVFPLPSVSPEVIFDEYVIPYGANITWSKKLPAAPGPLHLSEIGNSIGACYLSFDSLSLEELSQLCSDLSPEVEVAASKTLRKLRIEQFFNPPADELLLTAMALSSRRDESLLQEVHDSARKLAHCPVQNVLIPEVDYNDPVAIAKALKEEKYLEYEGTIIKITKSGNIVTHKIRKTPQESFVIRALRALDVPGVVRSIIDSFKSGSST